MNHYVVIHVHNNTLEQTTLKYCILWDGGAIFGSKCFIHNNPEPHRSHTPNVVGSCTSLNTILTSHPEPHLLHTPNVVSSEAPNELYFEIA